MYTSRMKPSDFIVKVSFCAKHRLGWKLEGSKWESKETIQVSNPGTYKHDDVFTELVVMKSGETWFVLYMFQWLTKIIF